jgi:hypothetical protein
VEKDSKVVTFASLIADALAAAATVVAGAVLGLAYFAILRRTVRIFVAGGGWLIPICLTLGRMVGMVLLLTVAARIGAAALLTAFLGFLIARTICIGRTRRSV